MAWDLVRLSDILSEYFGMPVHVRAYADRAGYELVLARRPPVDAERAIDEAWDRNR